jgi:heptosyltransferase-1
MPEPLKNILIIKPSSLGDIVQALPALSALRTSFPDARIQWLVRTDFAPLIENHPHLNGIILFDRKLLGKAWYHPRAFICLLSLIRRLRHSKFDAVIDLQGLFRTASLAWLSGCKNRLGVVDPRELAHVLYTNKIPHDQSCIHVVDYYLKVAQAAGAADLTVQFVLPQNTHAADSVKAKLTGRGVALDRYAVLVPGSAHADKCWPIDRFAALADRISTQFNLHIVAIGTESEKRTVETLNDLANVPVADLAGQTSLPELTALLRTAKLVVTNDTGPGHIAAALGVPLVMIFGRVNPARLAPYGRSNCVVAINPYSRGLAIKNPDPSYDIKNITLDQVFQKLCEQIRPSSP